MASFRKAQDDLSRYITVEGAFDGVIAFSQGTSLASAFILEQQLRSSDGESGVKDQPFRCAVFISGRLPYLDVSEEPYHVVHSGGTVLNSVIGIPTVHIWGTNDKVEPGQGLALSEMCKSQNRFVSVHDGGHEVPGPRNKEALTSSVHAIKRMLAKLKSLS